MKLFINGIEADKSFVEVNSGLNYGRFNFEGVIIERYMIILSIEEFIDAIENDYNSIRDEIKTDDKLQNETSGFTLIEYGNIKQLIIHQLALSEIVETYLDRILFEKLLDKSNQATYIINSTDEVLKEGNSIVISGRCYQKR